MFLSAKAYAKINLSLDIVGVREDGYHLLKTVMQSISLYDRVTIRDNPAGGIRITCTDPGIPCDEKNIAYKCAEAFFKRTATDAPIHIHIEKNIPSQAGLGGGSADGAAVLVMLNELFSSPLTLDELCKTGAKIGADIPFCIVGGCALCEGIGDVITPIKSKASLSLKLIKPDFGISTAEAYKRFDSAPPVGRRNTDAVISALEAGDTNSLAKNLFNLLDCKDERIEKIKADLIKAGALGACMSGSGSAVYGIFENESHAAKHIPFAISAVSHGKGVELTASEE